MKQETKKLIENKFNSIVNNDIIKETLEKLKEMRENNKGKLTENQIKDWMWEKLKHYTGKTTAKNMIDNNEKKFDKEELAEELYKHFKKYIKNNKENDDDIKKIYNTLKNDGLLLKEDQQKEEDGKNKKVGIKKDKNNSIGKIKNKNNNKEKEPNIKGITMHNDLVFDDGSYIESNMRVSNPSKIGGGLSVFSIIPYKSEKYGEFYVLCERGGRMSIWSDRLNMNIEGWKVANINIGDNEVQYFKKIDILKEDLILIETFEGNFYICKKDFNIEVFEYIGLNLGNGEYNLYNQVNRLNVYTVGKHNDNFIFYLNDIERYVLYKYEKKVNNRIKMPGEENSSENKEYLSQVFIDGYTHLYNISNIKANVMMKMMKRYKDFLKIQKEKNGILELFSLENSEIISFKEIDKNNLKIVDFIEDEDDLLQVVLESGNKLYYEIKNTKNGEKSAIIKEIKIEDKNSEDIKTLHKIYMDNFGKSLYKDLEEAEKEEERKQNQEEWLSPNPIPDDKGGFDVVDTIDSYSETRTDEDGVENEYVVDKVQYEDDNKKKELIDDPEADTSTDEKFNEVLFDTEAIIITLHRDTEIPKTVLDNAEKKLGG